MTTVAGVDVPTDQLAEICRRYHVAELSVFGSALRRDFAADSDIDLLYVFENGARIGWIELHALQEELAELFDRPVDLVSRDGLHWLIKDDVLRSAQVLYAA